MTATSDVDLVKKYSALGAAGAGSTGFGRSAWERAIAGGMTPERIKAALGSSGLQAGDWVRQQLGGGGGGGGQSQLSQYAQPGSDSFGKSAWERALAGGMTAEQIKAAFPASGLKAGDWVAQQLNGGGGQAQDAYTQYQNSFSSAGKSYGDAAKKYADELKAATDGFKGQADIYESQLSNYRKQISGYESRSTEATIQADTISRERDKWKSEYEQLKAIGDRAREAQEDSSLGRLRTGSTVSGSNASRGSLQGGSAVSSASADGRVGTSYGRDVSGDNREISERRRTGFATPEGKGSYASANAGAATRLAAGFQGGGLSRYSTSRAA
jgi:hypothetical protein